MAAHELLGRRADAGRVHNECVVGGAPNIEFTCLRPGVSETLERCSAVQRIVGFIRTVTEDGQAWCHRVTLALGRRQAIEVERVTGIGPASFAWEANTLPLSYTRVRYFRSTGEH